MKVRTTLLSLALMAAATTTHAFADIQIGKVAAYDRVAKLLVMEDKTIFTLEDFKGEVPADLQAGDQVEIDTSGGGEDGYGVVLSIRKL